MKDKSYYQMFDDIYKSIRNINNSFSEYEILYADLGYGEEKLLNKDFSKVERAYYLVLSLKESYQEISNAVESIKDLLKSRPFSEESNAIEKFNDLLIDIMGAYSNLNSRFSRHRNANNDDTLQPYFKRLVFTFQELNSLLKHKLSSKLMLLDEALREWKNIIYDS